jgi:hypothetical protein
LHYNIYFVKFCQIFINLYFSKLQLVGITSLEYNKLIVLGIYIIIIEQNRPKRFFQVSVYFYIKILYGVCFKLKPYFWRKKIKILKFMNAHSIFYYTRRPHKVGAIASEIVLVFNDVRFSFRLIKNSIIFFLHLLVTTP